MGSGVALLEKLELKGLTVQWETGAECTVVGLVGRITNSNSFELNQRVHRVYESGQYNIVLDLSSLEFVNSTGIAILYSLFSRSRDHGCKVVIGGLNPFLRNIFSLMEMPAGMDVEETIEDAAQHFRAP